MYKYKTASIAHQSTMLYIQVLVCIMSMWSADLLCFFLYNYALYWQYHCVSHKYILRKPSHYVFNYDFLFFFIFFSVPKVTVWSKFWRFLVPFLWLLLHEHLFFWPCLWSLEKHTVIMCAGFLIRAQMEV